MVARTEQPMSTATLDHLSDRELEVLHRLAEGRSNKEIGAALFIGVDTVKTHLSSIYRKLGVTRRGQAVALLRTCAGLIDEHEAPVTASIEPVHDGYRVTLIGSLDLTATTLFAHTLERALCNEPARVELDLSGIRSMDSSALRSLIRARNDHPNTHLTVTGASAPVRRLLEFTKLQPLFGPEQLVDNDA